MFYSVELPRSSERVTFVEGKFCLSLTPALCNKAMKKKENTKNLERGSIKIIVIYDINNTHASCPYHSSLSKFHIRMTRNIIQATS